MCSCGPKPWCRVPDKRYASTQVQYSTWWFLRTSSSGTASGTVPYSRVLDENIDFCTKIKKCHKMGSHASKIGLSGINKHVFYTKNTFLTSIRARNITFDWFLKILMKNQKMKKNVFSKFSKNHFELVKNSKSRFFIFLFFRSAGTVLYLEWARDTMIPAFSVPFYMS